MKGVAQTLVKNHDIIISLGIFAPTQLTQPNNFGRGVHNTPTPILLLFTIVKYEAAG